MEIDFKDLIVLDLANNHQGSVEHGLNIIRSAHKAVKKYGVKAAIKFQFRQLDSFIHPDHKEKSNNKHVGRFQSTRLTNEQYAILLKEVRNLGMVSMCTPFDEESVDVIKEMGFDIIKIASCSAKDWPLIEKVAAANIPVIFSTGGLVQKEIDDLVSFFDHKAIPSATMHCVSVYPTPDELCNLNNIKMLKERYKNRVIGWSTHEDPNDTVPIQIAVALGAEMFERHIGLETDEIKLNAYSSTDEQLDNWLKAYQKAKTLCGSYDRLPPSEEEKEALDTLRRGVYAKREIKKGEELSSQNTYFAMPYNPGQFDSNRFKAGVILKQAVKPNETIPEKGVSLPADPADKVIKTSIHEIKAMLNQARIDLGNNFEVEYSHHYGVNNFLETGVVIINCINREYCKKILIQLPGQKHPLHYHKLKEETFQVLWGEMYSEIDGRTQELKPGDTALVLPGVWHRFWTDTGVIFEEVSTTHYNNDSIYQDNSINEMERDERKTIVNHWGRYELPKKLKVAS